MNLYVLSFFAICICMLDRGVNRVFSGMSFLGILAVFIFMACRYGYGNDYFNYVGVFERYKEEDLIFGFEYFYKLINKFFFEFQTVIFFHSLIFIIAFISLYKAILKDRANLSVIGLLFFLNPYLFLIHLTALRQSLAISFFVIFFSLYLAKCKRVYIFIAVLLPLMFHRSAVVYVVAVPLILLSSKRLYFSTALVKILLMCLSVILVGVSTEILLKFDLLAKYSIYFEGFNTSNFSITTASYISSVFLVLLNATAVNRYAPSYAYQLLYGFVYLSLVLSVISLFFPMFSRVVLFFDFFVPFFIAISRFSIPRIWVYLYFLMIYVVRNYTFLSSEMWFRGFGEYRVFFL
jgi:transmembrane protein EpsG